MLSEDRLKKVHLAHILLRDGTTLPKLIATKTYLVCPYSTQEIAPYKKFRKEIHTHKSRRYRLKTRYINTN